MADARLNEIEFNRDRRPRAVQPEGRAVHPLKEIFEIVVLPDAVSECRPAIEAEKNRLEDRRLAGAVLAAKQHHGQSAPALLPWCQVNLLDTAVQTKIFKDQPPQQH